MPKPHQEAVMAIGAELEAFGTKEAMADDQKVAEVYKNKGAAILDLDEKTVDKWRAIARDTAWKEYAAKTPLSGELIKLAEQVHVS
jgi:TRAP-type C4-dicarboxylate transport system substrate-binding protein